MKDTEFSALDAFMALNDIDDEEVSGMLKSSRLTEGKQFSIYSSNNDLEKAKDILAEKDENAEIEVIDVDADSIDHLKKKEEYVGQIILRCNKCMANRFIDADKLVPSEDDPDVMNVEDECPHCHSSGEGYEQIGQVGKVEKPANVVDEEPAVDNDEAADEEAATFDNDLGDVDTAEETAEENNNQPESTGDEESDSEYATFNDEEESDGMETETSEDELDDLDLPDLGDEAEEDVKKDDDEEDVKEALNELYEVEVSDYAKEAWKMGQVMLCMNDEEAYYGSWITIWPDEDIESEEDAAYYFNDKEDFEDLKAEFVEDYMEYHEGGLFNAPDDVVAYAHEWDEKLGLAPIENILPRHEDKKLTEAIEQNTVLDFLGFITDPEAVKTIEVWNNLPEDSEKVYEGTYEDLPDDIVNGAFASFNVAEGYLTCNIDTKNDSENKLADALNLFDDEDSNKVMLWDEEAGDTIFEGTKEDAIAEYGDAAFISFESPEYLVINISDEEVISSVTESVNNGENLFEAICKANNLTSYKANKYGTEEYWLQEALDEADDLDNIFEKYCQGKACEKQFKEAYNYQDSSDILSRLACQLRDQKGSAAVVGYVNDSGKKVYLENALIANDAEQFNRLVESIEYKNNCHGAVIGLYNPAEALYAVKCGNGFYNARQHDFVDEEYATLYRTDAAVRVAINEAKSYFPEARINFVRFDKESNSENELVENVLTAKELPIKTILHEEEQIAKTMSAEEQKAAGDIESKLMNMLKANDLMTTDAIVKYYKEHNLGSETEYSDTMLRKVLGSLQVNEAAEEDDLAQDLVDIADEPVDSTDDAVETADQPLEAVAVDEPTTSDTDSNKILADLLIDEKEAVDGYNKALDALEGDDRTTNKAKEVLKHISEEELEHIEELSKVVAGTEDEIVTESLNEAVGKDYDEYRVVYSYGDNEEFESFEDRDEAEGRFSSIKDSDPDYVVLEGWSFSGEAGEAGYEEDYDVLEEYRRPDDDPKGPTNESFEDEHLGDVESDDDWDEEADEFDRANVEAEKATIEAEAEKSIQELEAIHEDTPDVVDSDVEYHDVHDIAAPAVQTSLSDGVTSEIYRVARTTADAIRDNYGYDVDPEFVAADIIQDLRLISRQIRPEDLEDTPINNLTKQMFQDYEHFYDAISGLIKMFTGRDIEFTPEIKLNQALKALSSKEYSDEAIKEKIASPQFVAALESGRVPFVIGNNDRQALIGEGFLDKYLNSSESVKSFKDRKSLGEAIEACKNNNRPYSIRRSTKVGFRYDLIEALARGDKEAAEDIKKDIQYYEEKQDDQPYNADKYEDEIENLEQALTEEVVEEAKKDEEIDKVLDSMEKVETVVNLIGDAVDAVETYSDAIETLEDSKMPNKEEIISKLHHIKGDELKHIDDLKDVQSMMPSVGDLADEPEKVAKEEPEAVEEPVEELPAPEELPAEVPEEPVSEALNENMSIEEALHGKKEIEDFFRLCKEIGIETLGDLARFKDEEKNRIAVNQMLIDAGIDGMSTDAFFETLKDYRNELGPDFKIKDEEDEPFVYDDPLHVMVNKKNEALEEEPAEEVTIENNDSVEEVTDDMQDVEFEGDVEFKPVVTSDGAHEVEEVTIEQGDENVEVEVKVDPEPMEAEADENNIEPDSDEELDFDEEAFDKDVNKYFDEAYEDSLVYRTTAGNVLENGTIMLEGFIKFNEDADEEKVRFTLTPSDKLDESLNNETLKSRTYKVTNDLSEEVFEYRA